MVTGGGVVSARAEDLRCSLCGDAIRANYVSYLQVGIVACSTCASKEGCASCGLPLAGRNRGEGSHCARCIDQAERCASCGRPIFGTYWEVTGTPGRFCAACREEASACTSCGAPTRSGTLRDGRVFCPACHRKLVEDVEDYGKVYRRIQERARTRLGLTLREDVPLIVESAGVIRGHPGLSGSRDALAGMYVRDADGDASIHVISNLTAGRLAAVLAHELAHAWQAEHCPEEQSHRVREGFAEWVAWHLVGDEPGGEAEREIISGRTDEYGHGFRLCAELEARHGIDHVLWWAQSVRGGEDGS
jgi:hypothetical protein